ncbi:MULTISPECIES: hypothetical protein [Mycetohabitans]|uniref:hypothetical protein n=1 Tax=Mycetohabitans TaxID=2571159 RepID=UPI0032509D83|nr:hypothetical protein [Mycetohabitans sp. B3]
MAVNRTDARSGLWAYRACPAAYGPLQVSLDLRATHAIDLFIYQIVRETGSLYAALGGLDALVFTAGIDERAQPVCARDAFRWLSVEVDAPTPTERIARASPH